MPFFSIIIPVYNAESYIDRCLDSVFSQDFISYEIIIVNDGSSDNSQALLLDLMRSNKKIKVIEQENLGVSAARNSGLRYAIGKYILFLDIDDWILDGYLSFAHTKLTSENLDGILLGYKTSDGKTTTVANNKLATVNGRVIDSKEYGTFFLKGYIANSPWNKIFSKKLYDNFTNIFPIGISVGEDAVAMAKIGMLSDKIGVSIASYLIYMQDTGGVTKTAVSIKKVKDIGKVLKILSEVFNATQPRNLIQLMVFKESIYYIVNGDYNEIIKLPVWNMFCNAAIELRYSDIDGWKWRSILFFIKISIRTRSLSLFLLFKSLIIN